MRCVRRLRKRYARRAHKRFVRRVRSSFVRRARVDFSHPLPRALRQRFHTPTAPDPPSPSRGARPHAIRRHGESQSEWESQIRRAHMRAGHHDEAAHVRQSRRATSSHEATCSCSTLSMLHLIPIFERQHLVCAAPYPHIRFERQHVVGEREPQRLGGPWKQTLMLPVQRSPRAPCATLCRAWAHEWARKPSCSWPPMGAGPLNGIVRKYGTGNLT